MPLPLGGGGKGEKTPEGYLSQGGVENFAPPTTQTTLDIKPDKV